MHSALHSREQTQKCRGKAIGLAACSLVLVTLACGGGSEAPKEAVESSDELTEEILAEESSAESYGETLSAETLEPFTEASVEPSLSIAQQPRTIEVSLDGDMEVPEDIEEQIAVYFGGGAGITTCTSVDSFEWLMPQDEPWELALASTRNYFARLQAWCICDLEQADTVILTYPDGSTQTIEASFSAEEASVCAVFDYDFGADAQLGDYTINAVHGSLPMNC